MDIIQSFYDNLASQYDKLFLDWQATTYDQAVILDRIFTSNGFNKTSAVLDCACGIGTQAIGLAAIGYHVTGSDISDGEIAEAYDMGVTAVFPINRLPQDFSVSRYHSEENLSYTVDNILRLLAAEQRRVNG